MSSIIEKPGYFTGLPKEYYFSEEIFQKELRDVVSRQWLYVGHVSQLREPGSYFVAQVGAESLIISRGEDGKVHALFNVCRHRGSMICEPSSSGRAKRFTCPYHQWSYTPAGKLRGAPGSKDGEDFSFADWSLQEAHCDTYMGTIFVYLAEEEPPSLHSVLSPICPPEWMAPVEPERVKRIHREVYEVKANWKALIENFSECYHCAGSHANTLNLVCDYRDFYRDAPESELGGSQAFPMREGMQTFSPDGKWVSKKPLGTPQADGFSTGYTNIPLFTSVLYWADHGIASQVTPLSVDRTQCIFDWYVHEDAVEGVDYDVASVVDIFHRTNLEDVELTERNYAGMTSSRFIPGPNNPEREWFIKAALDRYLELMDSE